MRKSTERRVVQFKDAEENENTKQENDEKCLILISSAQQQQQQQQQTEEDSADSADPFSVNSYFFDSGYTAAALTGFLKIWLGSHALSSFLSFNRNLYKGKRVVELGSGLGFTGLVAAFGGAAKCTLTDVNPVVDGILKHNILQNASTKHDEEDASAWVKRGRGKAQALALNWEEPEKCHALTHSDKEEDAVDVTIAAECIWLADLLDPFCKTLNTLFEREHQVRKKTPAAYISNVDRSSPDSDSKIFASKEMVEAAFKKHNLEFSVMKTYPNENGREVVIYTL